MGYPEEIENFNERIRGAIGGSLRGERRIWVTALSYCLRKTALDIYLHAYNPSHSWEARIGSALHSWLAEIVGGADFEGPVEYPLYDGWKLVGRADAVKGPYVLEFKFRGFDPGRNTGPRNLDEAEPAREWVEQINTYMGILGKRKGYIYIFDRNGLDFRVFPVEFDGELFERFIRRAELVVKAVEELERGTFPRWISTVGRKTWVCNHCPYRPICAEIDGERLGLI